MRKIDIVKIRIFRLTYRITKSARHVVRKQLHVWESLTATKKVALIIAIYAMMINYHWLVISLRFTDEKVRQNINIYALGLVFISLNKLEN